MTLREARRRHPDSFIVMRPLKRDAGTGRPLTFQVLVACFSAEEAIAAERQYTADGFEDVCILPNYGWDIGFPPEEAARLFRVLYGMNGAPPREAMRMFRVAYEGCGDDGGQ